MNAREQKAETQRKDALRAFLSATDGPRDPASLARSYALPQPIVERMIRETGNA